MLRSNLPTGPDVENDHVSCQEVDLTGARRAIIRDPKVRDAPLEASKMLAGASAETGSKG